MALGACAISGLGACRRLVSGLRHPYESVGVCQIPVKFEHFPLFLLTLRTKKVLGRPIGGQRWI